MYAAFGVEFEMSLHRCTGMYYGAVWSVKLKAKSTDKDMLLSNKVVCNFLCGCSTQKSSTQFRVVKLNIAFKNIKINVTNR